MALVNYIVYTEPENVQHGNNVKIHLREWDTETKRGKSRRIIQPVEYIIPSFEQKRENISSLLEKFRTDYPETMIKDGIGIPQIGFEERPYGFKDGVIWAIVNERRKKKERKNLPEIFLNNKVSFSQQLRFFYPPFTVVDLDPSGNRVILPKENDPRRQVDLETLIADNGCSLDIETVDYINPEKERISNVILNFGGDKKYLVTTFVHPTKKELWGCKLISVRESSKESIDPKESTKRIVKAVDDLIDREDPLKIFGYNLFAFDNMKLRKLGDGEYLPGADKTKPIIKSAQGLVNSMIKGRFGLDIYCYKFMCHNLYENNKLQTHARMEEIPFTKSMPYEILDLKTRLGEKGAVKEMEKAIFYCSEDGEVMLKIGKNNEPLIWRKAILFGRSPETICTSAIKNIMKEHWEKEYFLKNHTLKNRYEYGYKEDDVTIMDLKKESLKIGRKDGIFKNVSLVYPLFFINAFDEKVIKPRGVRDHLSFDTPMNKLDSYQTLDGYIYQLLKTMREFKEKARKSSNFNETLNKMDYIMKKQFQYGDKEIGIYEATGNIHNLLKRTNEILEKSELINYSNKFVYMTDPEELLKENLAFEYGRGSCLSCGPRVISLIDGKLIYQGFGLSKGSKCTFDVDLMRELLKRKLSFENNKFLLDYMKFKFEELGRGKIKNRDLIFKDRGKKKFNGKEYGFYGGKEMVLEDFLGVEKPDYTMYAQNFAKAYNNVLETIFPENVERNELSEMLGVDFKTSLFPEYSSHEKGEDIFEDEF